MNAGHNAALAALPREDLGALLGRTALRDEAALGSLYDSTAALVHGLALRIVGERGAAEEVTGDVYLQVWRQAVRYDATRGTPLAWLLTLTRSRAIDRLRSRGSQPTEPLRAAAILPCPTPSPEEHSHLSQRRGIIRRVMATLPAEQRHAIELAYFEGLSHTEVAAALGEPLGTIKTRIRLGMLRLREALAAIGKDAF